MLLQHTLHDFCSFKFVKSMIVSFCGTDPFYHYVMHGMCFLAYSVVYLVCSVWVSEECVPCCPWMQYFLDVHYIQLMDGVVEFRYVLVTFCAECVHFWRQGVEVSNHSTSSHSPANVPTCIWSSVVNCIHIKDCHFFLFEQCVVCASVIICISICICPGKDTSFEGD